MSTAVEDSPAHPAGRTRPDPLLPVSGVQRALIVSSLMAPPGTDHLHVTIRSPRRVQRSALQTAWRRLLTDQPLLASAAYVEGPEVDLRPAPEAAEICLQESDADSARALADADLGRARTRRLVLGAPLARLSGVTAPRWGSELLLSCHHAVADGRSLVTILDRLLTAYDAAAAGRHPVPLPAPPWADFVAALAARPSDPDYWRAHLAGPAPRPAFAAPSADGAQVDPIGQVALLSHRDTEALAETAHRLGVSFATLVQSAWALVLAARTPAERVLFGVTLATRWGTIRDVDRLVGPGINTVPVCLSPDPAEPLSEVIARVRATLRDHRDHQSDPLGECLARAGAADLLPLLDSIVMVDHASIEQRVHRAHPTWRDASVTIHRHLPVAVGLWAFDERPARLELTVDRRTMTAGAAGELMATMVEALHLLTQRPTASVGAAIEHLARLHARPAAVPVLAHLPPVTRVDRRPYAIAEEVPEHLVALGPQWGLWRDLIVRSTALEFDAVDTLADEHLSALADAAAAAPGDAGAQDALAAALPAAGQRLNEALHRLGRDPRVREAIAWQNRGALHTGVDAVLRREPASVRRNTKHRQHEALLGSYVQRYAAKNDTIGFFGPLGWGRLVPGDRITLHHGPAPLAARTTYLEGWAISAVLEPWNDALRPDLAPQRRPHIGLAGDGLRIPHADPVPLTPGARSVLLACDGSRPARAIAAEIAAPEVGFHDPQEVLDFLDDARRRGWIAWELAIAPEDAHGEVSAQQVLDRLPDSPATRGAATALAELVAARDALAAAAGDAEAVIASATALDETFTRLTGQPPTRRAGELYAGRTVAYEDCRLGIDVAIGADLLADAAPALEAVLTGARWYVCAAGRLLDHLVRGYHAERASGPSDPVPLADIWALVVDVVSEESDELLGPVSRGLADRWARVLALPENGPPDPARRREIRLDGAAVAERARAEFAIDPGGWQGARQHGPDLMVLGGAAGRTRGLVLGEIHPGVNCLRYRTWVEHHEDPARLRRAMLADIGEPAIWQAATGARRGMPTRLTQALDGPRDLWLACATDALGPPWERMLRLGDLDLLPGPDGMWLHDRGTGRRVRFLDAIADLLTGSIVQGYRVLPKTTTYSPRVWIDSLVVARERWSFPVAELAFAWERDEGRRFVAARSWASAHAMPRRLFMTTTGEKKPVYLDRDSLISTDLLSRAVRRAAAATPQEARITVTEMLPAPDDLWLRDAAGHRHTAELRLVATDRTGAHR